MSYGSFNLALKSTIDFYAKNLADALGYPFADLAGAPLNTSIFESDQPAICWEYESLHEDPRDPLWYAEFHIGAITRLDPAQYLSLDIVGEIQDLFKVGNRFMIRDYSGPSSPIVDEGAFIVVSSGVSPQQTDQVVMTRFVSIGIRANRQ